MSKKYVSTLLLLLMTATAWAQLDDYSQITSDGQVLDPTQRRSTADSLGTDKEIPKGIKAWTVDERFGDRREVALDTVSHMFMNSIFTTGLRGEYNTTGNLGSPRIHRIAIDRPLYQQFIFTQPYSYFITPVEEYHFTNTLSPFTNLTYNTCGDRTNGEDHLVAKYAVNAGRRLGFGFKFDYLYGRGYYSSQSSSHFNYTIHGSYLGDRYQAHLLLSTNHQKVAENGGINNDFYITHPESFSNSYQDSELPTVLNQNWNRNDNQHVFLSHRYSVGFKRKIPMTEDEIKARKFALAAQKDKEKRDAKEKKGKGDGEDEDNQGGKQFAGRPDDAKVVGAESDIIDKEDGQRIAVNGKAEADSLLAQGRQAEEDTTWLKDEYVPVTSFIHTMKIDNYRRIYQAYETPTDYYAYTYYNIGELTGDSIYDKTQHLDVKNTLAISLLEGFNKWAKAGLKGFVTSDLRHFTLPDSLGGTNSYNDHNLSIGAQLSKTQGNTLHYNATVETWLSGDDAGQLKIDATADLNFPLFGDTVTLAASGFVYHQTPTFYFKHYHSRHYWWDNSLDKIIHTRIQGLFSYRKTHTTLRVAFDEIKNHTYLSQSYQIGADNERTGNTVKANQCGDAISLITASLTQDLSLGPLHWENVITWQKSTKADVLPVPDLNIYTNLYLRFRIARVLNCEMGADAYFFTKYYAPDYSPALGQYTVQEGDSRMKVGGYPILDAYANFQLKHTRFFVMMSHVNAGMGNREYFLTPHYPQNGRILRFGVSWNFFN